MNIFIHINTRYVVQKISVFSVLLLAALVSGFFVADTTKAAGPWYVTTTGDDTNDCLSVGTACLTIQAAIDAASSGDTINVAAGTYSGDVNINKPVSLLGAQAAVNPNDGSWNDTRTNAANESIVHGAVNLGLRNNIVVDGFTIERTPTSEGHILIGAGNLGVEASSSFDIRNNRFIGTRSTGTTWAAIHTNFLNDATLPGAQFVAHQNRMTIAGTASGAGILALNNTVGTDGLGSTTITGNYAANSPSNGFNLNRPGASALVSGNRLVNDDIFTFRANNTVITGNTVSDAPQTAISNTGGSTNWTASNNTIINPRAQGILAGSTNTVDPVSGVTIQNNTITVDPSLVAVGVTTVFSPFQYAYFDMRGNLTGTNLINNNTLSLNSNTRNPSVVSVYGVRVRGNVVNLTVSNNVLNGNGVGGAGDATLPPSSAVFVDTDTVTSSLDLHIQNNSITGWVNGVSVFDPAPGSFGGLPTGAIFILSNNGLSGNTGFGVQNGTGEIVVATQNWWGSSTGPTHSTNPSGTGDAISDNVTFDPWYTNASRTALSNDTNTDAVASSSQDGQADLPPGVTDITLTDDTVLDLSAGTSTASGGIIVVEGASQSLDDFTNGDLSNTDLTVPQTIGDVSVTVDQAVNLQSGTNNEPIVLTNSDLSNVSLSIPDDTTVLAPAGWDGTIEPPKAGSSSGTAPSGFSVGSTVIEVGSPDFVLLFDRPVTITLTGVTGAVGYKPAGSSVWTQITDTCGGDYANPTLSAAEFPGECKVTNGSDTKILTYHLTTFGSLNTVDTGGDGGGGGGGYYIPPSATPTPTPGLHVTPVSLGFTNLAALGLKEGDTISADGNPNDPNFDPDVYIPNIYGYKRLFLNPVIFSFYGHLGGFTKVHVVPPSTRDIMVTSGLFRNCEIGDPKVYGVQVTGEDIGILHWVNTTGVQAVTDDPEFFKKVFCINSNEFNWYPKGTDYASVSQIPEYRRQTFAPATVLHRVKVVSTTPYLNVRNAPYLTGTIIGRLMPGEVVNYTQISNGGWWYKIIQSNGVSGWVSAKYVTVVQ